MLNQIKEILFHFFPKKTAGSTLLWTALALLSLCGLAGVTIQYTNSSGMNLSFSDGGGALPSWLVVIFSLLSISMFILGISLLVADWSKNRNERKNKAKSITLLSLPISKPPQIEVQFYQTIESSRTVKYSNLIKKEGESDIHWLSRSAISLNKINNNIVRELESEDSSLVLAVGALAHVPHVFGLGFLLANRRNINYYCWDRDRKDKENNNWVDVRNIMGFKTQFTHKLIQSHQNSNIRKMGLSIEVSMNNDEQNFMDKLNLDAVAIIHIDDKKIGNLFSYEAQMSLVVGIRDYLNKKVFSQYKEIEELHITIMGQASFIMRLASEFNQNHFPPVIKAHHYEKQEYPWCAVMKPNNSNITFEMNQNT
jgi:hypothetical protein